MADDAAVHRLGTVTAELYRTARRAAHRRARRTALPEAQIELLLLVRAHPEITVKEAAARLQTAPNTVSTLVGALSDAGMLDRDRDPADRRLVRLRITEAARQRMADHERRRAEVLAEALSGLDPADRAMLLAAVPVLDRLRDRLAGGG